MAKGKRLRHGTARSRKAAEAAGDPLKDLDRFLIESRWRDKLLRGRRKYATVSALAVVVVLVGVLFWTPGGPSFLPVQHPSTKPTQDFIGGTKIQGPLLYQPTLNPCTGDYRPDYGLNCTMQKEFFGGLPFLHADLYDWANLTYNSFVNGGLWDISSLGPDYWYQPEFYPAWGAAWPTTMVKDLSSGYQTPYGFGVYPFIRGWDVPVCSPEGQGQKALTSTDLLHTSWSVTHWQGLGLYAYYPFAALNLNGTTHFVQDPSYVSQHTSVVMKLDVTNQEQNDPYYEQWQSNASFQPETYPPNAIPSTEHYIVLGPTNNPVYTGFHKADQWGPGWVAPMQISITLKNPQPGDKYVVSLYTSDTSNEWLTQQYAVLYGRYFTPNGGSWYTAPLMEYVIYVQGC